VTPGTAIATLDDIARVYVDFPVPETELAEVALVHGTRPALVVPELAVQQIGTETFVWRVKQDNTVEKADVVVGGRVPGKVMLKDGIRAGDRIVVEGTGKLQPDAKVVEGGSAPAADGAKK
jgi:membrane fusion protein (multidrug efflux system)